MWFLKKKPNTSRIQTASAVLLGVVDAATTDLLVAVVGEDPIEESRNLLIPLKSELLIFGLHLTDRIAFSRLGASGRSSFMDALLLAVQQQLQSQIASQLEHLYNTRNTFYGSFPKLCPDKQESLKDTLFWEFGKALGSVYADNNPVAIMGVSMFGMTFMQSLHERFEKMKVFS